MRSPEEIYADIEHNNGQLKDSNQHLYLGAMLVNLAELMVALAEPGRPLAIIMHDVATRRYLNDVKFHQLVSVLRLTMKANDFSSLDIVAAATIAAEQNALPRDGT